MLGAWLSHNCLASSAAYQGGEMLLSLLRGRWLRKDSNLGFGIRQTKIDAR